MNYFYKFFEFKPGMCKFALVAMFAMLIAYFVDMPLQGKTAIVKSSNNKKYGNSTF